MVAERRFPVRIKVAVPPGGFGQRHSQIGLVRRELRRRWLGDEPSGMRGVLNDAVSIYFLDATLASAFVARWCAGYKVETTAGVYEVRADEPTARTAASVHRTP
jgi:hypothetical protein